MSQGTETSSLKRWMKQVGCIPRTIRAAEKSFSARAVPPPLFVGGLGASGRSEEHTSELQSLMRISYAVFCLKKNKTGIKRAMTATYLQRVDRDLNIRNRS